jgi:hypothetical protein
VLDLHLVLWELEEEVKTPLHQLTHDLAETFIERLAEDFLFPNVLRRVVCHRMNADAFDGDLHFEWAVDHPEPTAELDCS